VLQPLQSFLQAEAAGGVLLLGAALVALVWANSPFSDSYSRLWDTELTFRLADWAVSQDLRHVVNDGLMSLFFLVVGLEIKREILTGELRFPRAAALSVVAAVGGMVLPALIYAWINAGTDGAQGWGIPMATDIAFAVGVLTLAAKHAPPNLKPFLLSVAIVDDIGAIVVIALFYSGGITWGALGMAIGLCGVITILLGLRVRATMAYVVLAIAVWIATLASGIHPTIAGVALGLLTPAAPFQRPRDVSEEAHRVAAETVDDPSPPEADDDLWYRLAGLSREAVSPLGRLEHALHPYTSWVIVPLFALANAGVSLSGSELREAVTSRIAIGIVLGLLVGKVVGIMLASAIAVRVGLARLPESVGWRHITGAATVAGIGFTVSLFITELALDEAALVATAKVAILAASLVAGVAGYALLRSAPEATTGRGGP
jgi:NhaA family Na+:H+ antiporter